MMKWYECSGGEADVIVSTRVRLARNLDGWPFPGKMKPAQRRQAAREVVAAVSNENAATSERFAAVDMERLSKAEAVSLVERHLVTADFIAAREGRVLLHTGDESLCIMLNGGDHLRLRSMAPGLDLEGAFNAADTLESILGRMLPFSFDPRLGYLCQDPVSLGTGMHASLMLHLPGMSRGGAIERMAAGLSKLGLHLQASASEGQAEMYLLSNRVTMGLTEAEAMTNLKSIGLQLVVQERSARAQIFTSLEVQDTVSRSLGVLQNARMLSNDEFMELISNVRLGVAVGYVQNLPYEQIASLIVQVQPATLNCCSGAADRAQNGALRAELAGRALAKALVNRS